MSAVHFNVLPRPKLPFIQPTKSEHVEQLEQQQEQGPQPQSEPEYYKLTKNEIYFIISQSIIFLLILFLIFYLIMINQKLNFLLQRR